MISILSYNVLDGLRIGGRNFNEGVDFFANQILLPLGGLMIAVFAGWGMLKRESEEELSAMPAAAYDLWYFLIRFVVPPMSAGYFCHGRARLGTNAGSNQRFPMGAGPDDRADRGRTVLHGAFSLCPIPLFRAHVFGAWRGHASSRRGTSVRSRHWWSVVAGRVGAGNIAGVAVAITLGWPGCRFWMWLIGLMGMATSFFECSLAQLFKRY